MSKPQSGSHYSSRWLWFGGACVLGLGALFYFRSRSKKPPPKKKPTTKRKKIDSKRESTGSCSKKTYLAVLNALIDTMNDVLFDLSKMEVDIRREKPSATPQEISELLSIEYSERMKRTRAQVFEANSTTEQACQTAYIAYQEDSDVAQLWKVLVELEKKLAARGITGDQPQPQQQQQQDILPPDLTLDKVTHIFAVLMERLTQRMDEAMRVVQQYHPPPSPEQRETLIKDLYMKQIELVQMEVFTHYGLNAKTLDLAIQTYLQNPIFKATVDRLREEQKMTFTRLSQIYWP